MAGFFKKLGKAVLTGGASLVAEKAKKSKALKAVLTGGASLVAEKAKKSKALRAVITGGASLVGDKLKQKKKTATGVKTSAAAVPSPVVNALENSADNMETVIKDVKIESFENNAPPMIPEIKSINDQPKKTNPLIWIVFAVVGVFVAMKVIFKK